MDDRLLRLEEKIAYLERHVTEQDKAMLEMSDDVARLRLQLVKLREQLNAAAESGVEEKASERPPHY